MEVSPRSALSTATNRSHKSPLKTLRNKVYFATMQSQPSHTLVHRRTSPPPCEKSLQTVGAYPRISSQLSFQSEIQVHNPCSVLNFSPLCQPLRTKSGSKAVARLNRTLERVVGRNLLGNRIYGGSGSSHNEETNCLRCGTNQECMNLFGSVLETSFVGTTISSSEGILGGNGHSYDIPCLQV